jgi:hypothetical protein
VAKGWRMLYEEYKKGLLPDYYYAKVLSHEELRILTDEGKYILDVRLRDFLKDNIVIA